MTFESFACACFSMCDLGCVSCGCSATIDLSDDRDKHPQFSGEYSGHYYVDKY